ncbi:UpxY family transcription antiterminator [Pedobacter cryoconitis]|uniref:Transcriptional antiterminator RfaH n=1 Tax=Pedobacter cryoconitis TaxID=188932 RepID=A0A327SMJ5_9SPHI|nr:UpxY family transcription antiterminator [Pedobacter cryoconitis]RAJ26907.1 transcriptional antiterminator RfaH [Pedobacter cryoconitis]
MTNVVANKWHIVYTRPKSEKKVAAQLDDLGVNYLLPLRNETRNLKERKKIVNTPLFPSYIFVQPINKKSYFEILDLHTVVNYVKVGKDIAVIPQSAINNLNILISQNCAMEVTTDRFKVGQSLLINEGLFKGLLCEVVNIAKKDLILVRLDVFNRHLLIDIPKYMFSEMTTGSSSN